MSIMVLGTASHVGKSTVVTAICRLLHRRSIRHAPYKSQNMSLNSYVTREGGEIGIAQAMQAIAAGLEPDISMNPILLKPKGDQTSQIVLMGKPYRDVKASSYYNETDYLLEIAIEAANVLLDRYQHLVIEGAGGAAEVNLYSRDIANIRLAQKLRYPIILVADIERGGVFAQVYGTISLLPDEIRSLVKGVIINKFRGDPALFDEGITILEALCHIPVLGLVPATDIAIPSEDSLSLQDKKVVVTPIRIAVIHLPRISNFTDFELLERHASVSYVKPGENLGDYDAIIIPGTKNTVEDLQVIQASGAADQIRVARARGAPVIGICGGYQMLCTTIIDSGVESCEGEYRGIGLIPGTTQFIGYEKTTTQVTRCSSGVGPILSRISEVSGYEIHMGDTNHPKVKTAFLDEGAVSDDGLVIGTYMHGLFTNPSAVKALVSYLCEQKGIIWNESEEQGDPFDALADHFEKYVRFDEILKHFK
ncbi:cobyric acid synthase [Methanospirillum lacunae]|uniref:Probable cobyric acid synthase n=1 Tax=Methanospirillum lacunae TaxID=668570 RepID=A0A2V2N4K9_9EURY|nr:cobyric acid synthase [Methanospirillum lacunae]PWR72696.1 cobyric acid synthase CobQ [Methanospirillum lacunae]